MYTMQGKNPTNTTRMLPTPVHVRPAYASCGQSPYVATFHESSTELSRHTAPEKRAPDTILSASADWSVGPYTASLLSQPMKQWGQSQASINDRLLGLLGPDHQHAIGTFNTCSRVPTPQSLTDIGGCYHKENPEIATAHSSPFPSEGSTDAPNWPRPVSTFNQVLTTKQKFWVLKNLWPPCGLSTTQPSTVAYIYA
jgi:hypothetical protein